MELNFVFRSQILISEYTLEFRFKKGGRDRKRAKDSQNGFERSRGSVYHEILRRISNSSRFQATGGDRFRGKHRVDESNFEKWPIFWKVKFNIL